MPFYKNKGWKEGDFKHSENYYRNCISLPIYPTLSLESQEFVLNKILKYYNH